MRGCIVSKVPALGGRLSLVCNRCGKLGEYGTSKALVDAAEQHQMARSFATKATISSAEVKQ